jgi:hypothetical protein
MASIQIKPVSTKTTGGFAATIDSIDPTNSDCLEGTVVTPGAGQIPVLWDLSGIARDKTPSCNLDMRNNETADLRDTAKKLGAT